MTVCIAVVCDDRKSAVVASDTMVTNPGIPIEFEHHGTKISPLSPTCLAMTAGDALAYTELFGMVRGSLATLKQPSVFEIVDRIKECYKDVRHQEIRERVLGPRGFAGIEQFYDMQRHLNPDLVFAVQAQIDRYDYGLEILVAGATQSCAHIYSVSNPGTSQCYDAIDFHAIGSGTPHALNAIIARECHAEMPLYEAILVVYEAKRMAQKAPGVGTVTDMAIVTNTQIVSFRREEIRRIEPIFQKWLRQDHSWQADIAEWYRTVAGTEEREEG